MERALLALGRSVLVPMLVATASVQSPHRAAAGEAPETSPSAPTRNALGDVLASLTLPDLDGKPVDLGTLLGDGPVILDFWATWCKPCLVAMPELQALHEELGPRGLRVVGINEDGPRNTAKVRPFLQSRGFTFPVLLDLNREAQRRLQAIALPTTLVLDAKGVVLHSSFGYRPGEIDKLRLLIEPHLTPKPE